MRLCDNSAQLGEHDLRRAGGRAPWLFPHRLARREMVEVEVVEEGEGGANINKPAFHPRPPFLSLPSHQTEGDGFLDA